MTRPLSTLQLSDSHSQHIREFKAHLEKRMSAIIACQTGSVRLQEALEYATKAGGKLIRPQLVYEFAALASPGDYAVDRIPAIIDCAASIEFIHTYSLIHDDLPAMDNALLRRGRKTCWAAYDEATAILVGDALIPLAFEILSDLPEVAPSQKLILIRLLSKIAGPNGLVAGQMLDLYPDVLSSRSQDKKIEFMQLMKTGVLLGASCGAGVLLGGREDLYEKAISFGEQLGLLYQLTDDLLDLMGLEDVLGKTVHNDENKQTFLSVYGVEKVQNRISEISFDLNNRINRDFMDALSLKEFIQQIINRQN